MIKLITDPGPWTKLPMLSPLALRPLTFPSPVTSLVTVSTDQAFLLLKCTTHLDGARYVIISNSNHILF